MMGLLKHVRISVQSEWTLDTLLSLDNPGSPDSSDSSDMPREVTLSALRGASARLRIGSPNNPLPVPILNHLLQALIGLPGLSGLSGSSPPNPARSDRKTQIPIISDLLAGKRGKIIENCDELFSKFINNPSNPSNPSNVHSEKDISKVLFNKYIRNVCEGSASESLSDLIVKLILVTSTLEVKVPLKYPSINPLITLE